jgi:hypothetical protein
MIRGPEPFTVTPNPVTAGGSVTVSGPSGATVWVTTPGGTRKKVVLDGNGEATVPEPVGAEKCFSISDFNPPRSHTIKVCVVSGGKTPRK